MRDWRLPALLGLLGLYGVGLATFPPPVVLISDESEYVRQAAVFAQGHTHVAARDPLTGAEREELASTYAPGTSLLQAPFVLFGGWRGAVWASYLALCWVTLLSALWLKRRGLPISYAALVPFFIPASVLGRTGMGDLPSAAVVVTATFLLAAAPERPLAGGLISGATLLFRDSNPVFLVPWIASRLRERRGAALLILGGIGGASFRPLLAWVLQGSPFLVHKTVYPFTFEGALERGALYAFALCVLVPGGLLALGWYRGTQRPEVVGTVLLSYAFFSLYSYSGRDSGPVASVVLGPRYLIPLVPLLALAIGDVATRRIPSVHRRRALELSILVAAGVVTCVVHPLLHRVARRQATFVTALYAATHADALLVTEPGATAKYLNGLYGNRTIVDKLSVPAAKMGALLARGPVQVVFVDRFDSAYWREMARLNQEYLETVAQTCEVQPRVDRSDKERLRVLDVVKCQ